MFTNLNELDDGQILTADICIIGAGPAGISIATTVLEQGTHVCLIESGGLEANDASQALAEGEVVGRPTHDLRTERNRLFGGSTNSWAGACAPMSELDFNVRPWLGLDGWPYSYADLEPFYRRAQALFEIGPFDYGSDCWLDGGHRCLWPDPTILENRIWQLSPRTNFGRTFQQQFRESRTIRILLHATATELLADEAVKCVSGVAVRSLSGKQAIVKARSYVLACGGIDNPRLLLLSRRSATNGLGNDHDLVGRYFMQHPHVGAASITFSGHRSWVKSYKDARVGGTWIRRRIGMTGEAQRRLGILNSVASIVNRFITDSLTHSQSIGYLATKRLILELARGHIPLQLPSELKKIARDLPGLSAGTWQHLRHRTGALYFMGEQFPNPESRVTLSPSPDALGLAKARVDWRLSPVDKRSIRVMVAAVNSEFRRLNLAAVEPDEWLLADDVSWPDSLNGGYHHMGTTRMGTHPRNSVVDPDARVHGIDNLYVAGSSIFPTVGCANPTLTLVATSLKLADHLKGRLTMPMTATLGTKRKHG